MLSQSKPWRRTMPRTRCLILTWVVVLAALTFGIKLKERAGCAFGVTVLAGGIERPVLRGQRGFAGCKTARQQAASEAFVGDGLPVDADSALDLMVDEVNAIATSAEHHSATGIAAAADRKIEQKGTGKAARRTLQPVLTLPGDTLEHKPFMVAFVAAATALTGTAVGMAYTAASWKAFVAVLGGILAAEIFSGTFHWATDNYGSMQTPMVGSACAAFQGHHLAPWTITHRPFANNVYKIARAALPLILISIIGLPPTGAAFCATMFYCQILAQEFHRWSHLPARQLLPWQRWLMRCGLVVSTAEHCRHHKPPFAAHYCILTGGLNAWLDSDPVLFWRRFEALVWRLTGVEPNCWKGDKGLAVRDRALSLMWFGTRTGTRTAVTA